MADDEKFDEELERLLGEDKADDLEEKMIAFLWREMNEPWKNIRLSLN